MSAPVIRAYEDDTSTLISDSNPVAFTWTGSATAETEIDIWNNKGGSGADTAYNRRLNILVRPAGSADSVAYEGSGVETVDRRFVEARIKSGMGGLTVSSTDWQPLGGSSTLELPDLANDRGVKVGIRVNAASDADTDDLEAVLTVAGPEGTAIGEGFTESTGRDGIRTGIADELFSGIFKTSNVVEDPGGVSSTVQIQDTIYVHQGRPYSILQQDVTLNQNDSAAAALTAGQAYYARLSLSSAGIVTTKGTKAATPLTSANEPALPSGNLPLAMVRVDYDAGGGAIANGDITNHWTLEGFNLTTSGLVATFSPGSARVDNSIVRLDYASSVTLGTSTTSAVYLTKTGGLTSTATNRALKLRSGVVTDGSGITDSGTDVRIYTDTTPFWFDFAFDATFSGTQYAYAPGNPFNRDLYLVPMQPVLVWLDDVGSGLVSGSITFDLEYSTAGGAWTTLFTSSGTRDMRPFFEYNDTSPLVLAKDEPTLYAQPEVMVIPAKARVRMKAVTTLSGGTSPAGGHGRLMCALS